MLCKISNNISEKNLGKIISEEYNSGYYKCEPCSFVQADKARCLSKAYGHRVFLRKIRDAGYDFYREDQYCENKFAKHFDITETAIQNFDLFTAFEVLEHFSNPLIEIENVFKYADTAIFSTEIASATDSEIENWWYNTQETGQHVAFYSTKSMEIIAKKFNKNYYCKNGNIHIFLNNIIEQDKIDLSINNIAKKKYFFELIKKNIPKKINRNSLQQNDFH